MISVVSGLVSDRWRLEWTMYEIRHSQELLRKQMISSGIVLLILCSTEQMKTCARLKLPNLPCSFIPLFPPSAWAMTLNPNDRRSLTLVSSPHWLLPGALSFEDGLKLVYARAMAMQKACEAQPSTMAAILPCRMKRLRKSALK